MEKGLKQIWDTYENSVISKIQARTFVKVSSHFMESFESSVHQLVTISRSPYYYLLTFLYLLAENHY